MKKMMIIAVAFAMVLSAKADGGSEKIGDITWLYDVSEGNALLRDWGAVEDKGAVVGDVVIPSTLGGYPVTAVGYRALYECERMTSVVVPAGVIEIGSAAFSGCSALMSAVMPDSVTSVGSEMFYLCGNLTSVKLSSGLKEISNKMFYYCMGLSSITVPAGVTNIGNQAFFGCSTLDTIVFEGDAPALGSQVFQGVPSTCTVYVKPGSTGWNVDIPGKWNGLNIAYAGNPQPDEKDSVSPTVFSLEAGRATFVMPDGTYEVWAKETLDSEIPWEKVGSFSGPAIQIDVDTAKKSMFYMLTR